MKRLIACLILYVVLVVNAAAQLYDAQWMLGPATSIVDFRNDSVHNYRIIKWMNTKDANATVSDEVGNLLYYTNGIYIATKDGDSLINGADLSPCSYTTQQRIHGLNIPQSVMFLPSPENPRYYYLLHFSNDTVNNGRPGTLYFSKIDKQANFGLGEVIDKNHIYYKGVFWGGGLTTCKHANGRDWWVTMHGRNNNSFYTFLLTKNGIEDTLIQNIGPNYAGPFDLAHSCFSEDGSKYAVGTDVGPVTILDFDRCTGEFSNPIVINNKAQGFTAPGVSSLAFSPNGKYIYAATRVDLKQYDLTDLQDTSVIYETDSGDYAQMNYLELGPNGKLYCSTWNGGFNFLHVVNKPDEKGDSCNFVYAGQPTLSLNSFNLPNMPNYCLGPLAGSGCDTITTDVAQQSSHEKQQPRVQPNPANKYFYAEMPAQGNYAFELRNEAGQLIERKETRQVDIFNTEDLLAGTYILHVTDKNKGELLSRQKIVLQH